MYFTVVVEVITGSSKQSQSRTLVSETGAMKFLLTVHSLPTYKNLIYATATFVYLLFSSRTKFYISSDTIKNQPPLKSAIDFINGLRDLPMKRMVADEGILAGKLIINWTV